MKQNEEFTNRQYGSAVGAATGCHAWAARLLMFVALLAATITMPQRAWAQDDPSEDWNALNGLFQGPEYIITLDRDYTLGENDPAIDIDISVRLDLNGHSIKKTHEALQIFSVCDGGSLTLQATGGGSIEYTGNARAIDVHSGGTLTVYSGSITASNEIAIWNEGTTVIYGGYFSGGVHGVSNLATMTIAGGQIVGGEIVGQDPVYNQGTLTVIGTPVSESDIWNNEGTVNYTAAVATVCADEYAGEGAYTRYYTDFENAVINANGYPGDVTVTLLDNVSDIQNAITMNNINTVGTGDEVRLAKVTLDLNGHAISGDASQLIIVGENAVAKITDSSTGTHGSITTTGAVAITSIATLTVSNVTVSGANDGIYILGGDHEVTNCTVSSTDENASDDQAGIWKNAGTLSVSNCTVTGSKYGIYNNGGDLTVTNCDVSSTAELDLINYSFSYGICHSGGDLTVSGGRATSNFIGIGAYSTTGTQSISGCTVSGDEAISASGTATISGCTLSGATGINIGNTNANVTVGAGVKINGYTVAGILCFGNLTLSALPAFTAGSNTMYPDIMLYADGENVNPIQFDATGPLTAPTAKISVGAYEEGGEGFVAITSPYFFTLGYGAAFTDAYGNMVDPKDVFTVSGGTAVLVGNEAVASSSDKPLVAYTVGERGSVAGLYAKDGSTITTDGAALGKALSEATAGSDVWLVKDVTDVSDALTVSAGTAEAPVTLNMDGHKISGSNSDKLLQVSSGANLLIYDKDGTAEIENTATSSSAIQNNGTLSVTNCNVISGLIGIVNLGSLTVSGGIVEGTGRVGIINESDATLCSIGAATLKSNGLRGIEASKDVTLTAWPTFSGNAVDIMLSNGAKVVFSKGFDPAADTFSQISVFQPAIGADNPFTSGFSAALTGMRAWEAFKWETANYVVDADANGQGIFVDCREKISFPEGLSTYYFDHAVEALDADEKLTFYAVTGMSGDKIIVKELTKKCIAAGTPIIVSNTSGQEKSFSFMNGSVSWKKTEIQNTFFDDYGSASLYEYFTGTENDMEKLGPDAGIDYYGFNGEAFVKLDVPATVAAHRCFLVLPQESSKAGARRLLTIAFGGDGTTGIQTPPLEGRGVAGAGADGWYSLDGRRLSAQPTKKGVYVHQGRKVVVK